MSSKGSFILLLFYPSVGLHRNAIISPGGAIIDEASSLGTRVHRRRVPMSATFNSQLASSAAGALETNASRSAQHRLTSNDVMSDPMVGGRSGGWKCGGGF